MSTFNLFRFNQISLIFLLIVVAGCQSELGPADSIQESYLKKFSGEKAEVGFNILQTDDGGYLMVGLDFDNDSRLRIIKTNKHGEELSNIVENTQHTILPDFTVLSDGTILATGQLSSDYVVINQDGTIASHNEYNSTLSPSYRYSAPLEGSDGNLYSAYTNGYSSGSSLNYLSRLDQKGNEISWEEMPNTMFNAKIGTFELAAVNVDASAGNTYWFTGDLYHKQPWNWSDPPKTFFARVNSNGTVEVNIIDPDDDEEKYTLEHLRTKDNKFVSLHSNANWLFGKKYKYTSNLELIKWDEDLTVIWREVLTFPGFNYLNPVSFKELTSGNFLVYGYATAEGQPFESPFFAEFSSTGKLVYQKNYSFGGSAAIQGGGQHADGGYFFTGYVSSYGRGKEFTDQILLRTDNKGNFHAE